MTMMMIWPFSTLIFIVMEGVVRDFRDLMGLFLLGMKRRDSVINECLFMRYYLKISRDVEKGGVTGLGFVCCFGLSWCRCGVR